jgi:hypothetical protein
VTDERPASWPADVHPIGLEELDHLGINAKNELFWDGRRIVTRNKFYLTWPQILLAYLAAVASLATIATGLNNASVFLCARNLYWLGCPSAPSAIPPGAGRRQEAPEIVQPPQRQAPPRPLAAPAK